MRAFINLFYEPKVLLCLGHCRFLCEREKSNYDTESNIQSHWGEYQEAAVEVSLTLASDDSAECHGGRPKRRVVVLAIYALKLEESKEESCRAMAAAEIVNLELCDCRFADGGATLIESIKAGQTSPRGLPYVGG